MRLGALARSYGIYLVLIALVLVPSLWLSEYRGVLNLGQIVQQSAALAILAIGQTFVIACRMIDLSVGQLMGLIVVASCSLMDGRPEMTVPAILLALAIGLTVGAINGLLNNRLRIHSLILTLGMLSILQGVIFVYTDRSVGAASPAVLRIGNGTVTGVPVAVPLVLVVAALAALLLHRTRFGLYVRVVGANEEGARRAGIDIARVKLPVFILSGISAAIAGIILADGWAPAIQMPGPVSSSMRSSPWFSAVRRCQEAAAPSSERLPPCWCSVSPPIFSTCSGCQPSSRWW